MTGTAGEGVARDDPSGRDGAAVPDVRVLVVDDQPLLRHSLRVLVDGAPGTVVVGEAATGSEAVARAHALVPDVVLMDIRMPGGDGIEATRRITASPALAGTRVLVLSMFELDEYVYGALRAGASGFLLKDAHPEQLLDAVRRTHAGDALFAPAILARLVEHYVDRPAARPARSLAALTPRETEVLAHVARGLSNDEVAATLVISVKTVKTHVGNLLAKLHARDRAQLVIAAYESGLVGAA
ncbi:response regulator [Cellulomonas sp. B6]|uniref:response regulator n=1 Tax=Cellulomonas sp. B6 TaxID=1295626 RepID=UPI000A43D517